MATMIYWTLEPPAQWRAGFQGDTQQPFCFDCADCGAHEPPIAGILSSDGTYAGIAILGSREGSIAERNMRPAMFCGPCFAKRITSTPEEILQ